MEKEENVEDYMRRGKEYTEMHYSLPWCFNNPKSNVPILLHMYLLQEAQKKILKQIHTELKKLNKDK